MFWLIGAIKETINRSIVSWMDNHNPIAKQHYLHLKNLYIYPSRLGWAFLLLAFIIWLLGTNYHNNLILALAYFQLSIFTVTILNTYNNLAGLTIRFLAVEDVFAGEAGHVGFSIKNHPGKSVHHVALYFDENLMSTFEFPKQDEAHIENVAHPAQPRGKYRLTRLRIESRYPMGLFKCGTWLRFDGDFLVYPKPIPCPLPVPRGRLGQDGDELCPTPEPEEFYGFKPYVVGESMGSIAWKQWARGQSLMTYSYAQPQAKYMQLNWQDFDRGDKELALSNLCYWTIRLHGENRHFDVVIDGEKFEVQNSRSSLTPIFSAMALL